MNAKYVVAAMLLASASAMAAPENRTSSSNIESYKVKTSTSSLAEAAENIVAEDESGLSVDERLERAFEEQLSEDVSGEMPVIELLEKEDDIAEAWPVPKGDKVASTY